MSDPVADVDNLDRGSAGALRWHRWEPRSTHSLSFVLAVPMGILFLWIMGFAAILFSSGDCFGPTEACEPMRQAQSIQSQVLVVSVAGLSVLGLLAILVGRRIVPAALLVASLAGLLMGLAPVDPKPSWVPAGMGLLSPGLVILALASAGQVIYQVRSRPAWFRRAVE